MKRFTLGLSFELDMVLYVTYEFRRYGQWLNLQQTTTVKNF